MLTTRAALVAVTLLIGVHYTCSTATYQTQPHFSTLRSNVSPLKSCEPLRTVPAEPLALLRGSLHRHQIAQRHLRDITNINNVRNEPPEDQAVAKALQDPRSTEELRAALEQANNTATLAANSSDTVFEALKRAHRNVPYDWDTQRASHCVFNKIYPSLVPGRPKISFLMQHFKRPQSIAAVLRPLLACRDKVSSELLVNVDHPATAATWIELAYNTSGWVVPVFSANVHEIRAYNRLGHMARGQVLVLLQDDMVLSSSNCSWAQDVLNLFDRFPKLGAVGHKGWTYKIGTQGWAEPARFYDPILNLRVQFTSVADYAPFSVRKSALIDVGGVDEGLSDPGECGIYSDADLCMRLWASGYYVAHMYIPYSADGEEGSSHGKVTGARCWGKQIGAAGKSHSVRFPWESPAMTDTWRKVLHLNRHYLLPVPGKPCPYEPVQCQELEQLEQLRSQRQEEQELMAERQAEASEEPRFEDSSKLQQLIGSQYDRKEAEQEWEALQQEMGGAAGRRSSKRVMA